MGAKKKSLLKRAFISGDIVGPIGGHNHLVSMSRPDCYFLACEERTYASSFEEARASVRKSPRLERVRRKRTVTCPKCLAAVPDDFWGDVPDPVFKKNLYKTVIVVWSDKSPKDKDLTSLAYDVQFGDAYCAKRKTVVVKTPRRDADCDKDEWFEDSEL